MTEVVPPPHSAFGDSVPVVDLSGHVSAGAPVLDRMERSARLGPVFVQRFHGHDTLVVGGLDLVTELADEERFAKSVGPALVNVREFAGDGLFTAYNDEPNWARAHDLLMPAFALGSMRRYHPVMLRVARRLIAAWDRKAAAGTPVDVPEDMTRMTLDTIGLAGFGFDFGSFDSDEPHPFVAAMVRCLDWSMARLTRGPGEDRTEADRAFRADAAHLASVVDEVVAARTAAPDPGAEDLLQLMLTARHPGDGATLSAENIRNQVITFLIAGHETTSGTLAFALYFLSQHPEVLHRVQREADELWGDVADPEPTFEDVGRLRYTRQVLDETLRLWPTAPAFSREAREDTLLGGRIPLRAGQSVMVSTPALHRDPVWGDNPHLFDPSRFDPEREAARSPHAFKPFGTGERACIGRQFALHEATMLLGMLVHRYRLVDHARYRLDVKQTLTIKPDGLTLTLLPRTVRAARRTEGTGPAASASPSAPPARVLPGTGLLVLHGSNYGTCRELGEQLAVAAGDLGCDTEVAPLDAYADGLPTDRPVVVAAASYNGRPTDDAARFVRAIEEAGPGAMDGVTYAVLGVGDRNWAATYQRVPTLIDERLARLGGTRLLERAEGDASGDLSGAVREFTGRLGEALLRHAGDPDAAGAAAPRQDGPAYAVTEVAGGPLDALAARHGLVPVTVTETRGLTDPAHPRVKRLVRVALPEGVAYRTGDHLAVLPANAPGLVERAARVLGADPGTVLNIVPNGARRGALAVDRPVTVRELLTHHVELQDRPTAGQLELLARLDPCPPEQRALQALAAAPDDDARTLLDLIEDHPALREVLTWPVLLDLLPAIRPRTYSISSSPADAPGHADLMVSLLRSPARSGRGTRVGTGSGHLAAVRPGDVVLARVRPCREAFRVTHDGTPVIMVAAGTGLAPFRGAIADRRALVESGARLGEALCYFGCQDPEADYLHADELRAAERAGAVSMRPVFSGAPRGGLRFVQHRIAAEAAEVWRLLAAGARVHVCGDGRHMAPGVRAAFRDLYRKHTPGADGTAAADWLNGLMECGRYVEDVYAG
ncbi:cytochrome P450 [Streptomyces minutiscleroticus]|uniref:Bifunctional cytochrome P450/NADPH--P450 reductase n=1 Tax=Streptomyces minutiscleroticus TaxID=68238 RepID=A0A918U6M1_9ACTN|nr:cytochrome P450 [Streptomyces minutiscleroticus]GGY00417.1 bifunctional cytochrome P450/NADPH--P450 reductase 2 [Streptomyces minutiscleroticus]